MLSFVLSLHPTEPFPRKAIYCIGYSLTFAPFHYRFDLILLQHTPHRHGRELCFLPQQIVGNPLRSPSSHLTQIKDNGFNFRCYLILAGLDGRLDLSYNSDFPRSFSRFIQRYNVERAIPHRRAFFCH